MSAQAITQILQNFTYQSYFDSTLLHRALLPQSVGNPIVDTTRQVAQVKGRGIALHPASQSPVAIKFRGGRADSTIIVLTPGQKVMVGDFVEFEWGLPFGWLGGGHVVLYVIHDEKADVRFPNASAPVPFHRTRLAIGASPGAYTINWPNGFAWPNATVGAGAAPQPGGVAFHMTPDVTMMRLRVDLSAAAPPVPATFSLVFRGVAPFDLNSASPPVLTTTDLGVFDVTFNPQADTAGGEFALAWLPYEIGLLTGSAASVTVVDPANLYRAAFIDVVRYGRFM